MYELQIYISFEPKRCFIEWGKLVNFLFILYSNKCLVMNVNSQDHKNRILSFSEFVLALVYNYLRIDRVLVESHLISSGRYFIPSSCFHPVDSGCCLWSRGTSPVSCSLMILVSDTSVKIGGFEHVSVLLVLIMRLLLILLSCFRFCSGLVSTCLVDIGFFLICSDFKVAFPYLHLF